MARVKRVTEDVVNLTVNQKFSTKFLYEDFLDKAAYWYLSFGRTAVVQNLLIEVAKKHNDVINGALVNQYTKPNIFFMRHTDKYNKKGIIIELPKPFYDGDTNFVLMLFVGFKYYYVFCKYDYRSRTFLMNHIDDKGKVVKLNTQVMSPQDLWNKCIQLDLFDAF